MVSKKCFKTKKTSSTSNMSNRLLRLPPVPAPAARTAAATAAPDNDDDDAVLWEARRNPRETGPSLPAKTPPPSKPPGPSACLIAVEAVFLFWGFAKVEDDIYLSEAIIAEATITSRGLVASLSAFPNDAKYQHDADLYREVNAFALCCHALEA